MSEMSIPTELAVELMHVIQEQRRDHAEAAARAAGDFTGSVHPGGSLSTRTRVADARWNATVEWDASNTALNELRIRAAAHVLETRDATARLSSGDGGDQT